MLRGDGGPPDNNSGFDRECSQLPSLMTSFGRSVLKHARSDRIQRIELIDQAP